MNDAISADFFQSRDLFGSLCLLSVLMSSYLTLESFIPKSIIRGARLSRASLGPHWLARVPGKYSTVPLRAGLGTGHVIPFGRNQINTFMSKLAKNRLMIGFGAGTWLAAEAGVGVLRSSCGGPWKTTVHEKAELWAIYRFDNPPCKSLQHLLPFYSF